MVFVETFSYAGLCTFCSLPCDARDRERERIWNTQILFNKAIAPSEGVNKPYTAMHTQYSVC